MKKLNFRGVASPKMFANITLASMMLFACSEDDPSAVDDRTNAPVSPTFEYQLTGLVSQTLVDKSTKLSRVDRISATLTATDVINGGTETLPWFVDVDDESLTITSDYHKEFAPSTYTFSLDITYEGAKYLGVAENVEIEDTQETPIPFVIQPVIGEVNALYSFTEIPSLVFKYPELATLDNPKITYSIDGGGET